MATAKVCDRFGAVINPTNKSRPQSPAFRHGVKGDMG